MSRLSSLVRISPFVVLALVACAACAASGDDSDSAGADVTNGGDTSIFGADDSLFQNDRVGRQLKGDVSKIPGDYPALEQAFKMGRECKRGDKQHEIYIVDEKPRGEPAGLKLPRAVVTGCNTGDTSKPETARNSYSLMMALISDDSTPQAKSGDTMLTSPIETMALDDTTGLYNFYVFEPGPKGKPGTVSRFWRAKDGTIMTRQLVGGSGKPTAAAKSNDKRCFNCHVDGAPIMNELSEPWTNWISPKKAVSTANMSGMTKELVGAASLADQFEQFIRAATQEYTSGDSKKKGWLARTRDGLLPGGVAKMVRPLFCENELNYLSADTTKGVPGQVFFDPSLTAQSDVVFPEAPPGDTPEPFLFPIRSVYDESVQQSLVDAGYVGFDVAVAIRLLDDENDVFSSQRCGVYDAVSKAITAAGANPDPKKVAGIIKQTVSDKLASLKLHPAQLAYLKARLAEGDHDTQLDAYNAELLTRFQAMDKGVPAIAAKEKTRKDLARKLFPGNVTNSPLPDLDPPSP
jgi:hypothetical protein